MKNQLGNLTRSAALVLALSLPLAATAYETYSEPASGTGNCSACHMDFRGSSSTKGTVFPGGSNHEMHRNGSYMGTACNLCHFADRSIVYMASSTGTANNTGIGCSGCHEPVGLRKHHLVNGVTSCAGCHKTDPVPAPEGSVKPPYFGTVDTKANNAANTLIATNINENWSLGDFLGIDNDGNNLYDTADYAVGAFKLLSLVKEGNNLRVNFLTAGGRTNTLMAASSPNGPYTNLITGIGIAGVGPVTTNVLVPGGGLSPIGYFRLKEIVP